MKILPPVRRGETVRVRGGRWRVLRASLYDGQHQVVTLLGADTLNAGTTRTVITPFDLVEAAARTRRLRIVSIAKWRAACRAYLEEQALRGSADALGTAAAACIDLHPFQLEPALALVNGRGARVLIADEVGLGKTIQAALVIAELRARGAADRVLILVPAGVRAQWAQELRDRFNLESLVMDTGEGRRRATMLPVGVNPWTTAPLVIASIDYVKRPEVLAAVGATHWDVVVLDEAHGAAAGSDRHKAAATISRSAGCVLLLTATPHNGNPQAFRSLCDLGAVGSDDPLLVFRRTRREVAVGHGRRVHRLCVRPHALERRMLDALTALARAVGEEGTDNTEARLAVSVLHKRAFSSAHALAESAARRIAALGADEAVTRTEQLFLPLCDESDDSDQAPAFLAPMLRNGADERRLLANVLDAARAAVPVQGKLAALKRLLARLLVRGERCIVFTEYRDTLLHVRDALAPDALIIHGGMSASERTAAVAAFVKGTATLLLATDAAGEGLNLHATCRVVVNLELPWNPMRLEQRIGRVDRMGQRQRVHVFHLIARSTGEMSVLARLEGRIEEAHAAIGAGDPLGLLLNHTTPPPVKGLRLLAEAAAAHGNIVAARQARDARLRGAPYTWPPAGDIFVAFSKRRRIRAALDGRSLAIFKVSAHEGTGRDIAASLSSLTFTGRPPGRASGRQMLAALEGVAAHRVESQFAAWREANARIHLAFWNCRLGRERSISALPVDGDTALQRGLFDGRAEHEFVRNEERRRGREASAIERIARAERAREMRAEPAEPVLLLLA